MDTQQKQLRVLFDGMIVTQSVREQSVLVSTELQWGDRTVVLRVAHDVPRTFRGQTREHTEREQDYLRRIADLATSGLITCYSSQEITFETWGRPRNYSLAPEANPFRGVRFEPCRLPHQRSIMFGGIGEDRFEENKKKFLATIPDARFRALDRATGEHHAADCYHLWTAEVNGLDVFLTRERKFRNALRGQKKVRSAVEIMRPEDLCVIFPLE
jgi:hypothetical protein